MSCLQNALVAKTRSIYIAKRFEKAKEYTAKYRGVLSPCRHCGNTDIRIASDRSIFGKKTQHMECRLFESFLRLHGRVHECTCCR